MDEVTIACSSVEFRFAMVDDSRALAELNQQLIRDEGHRNPMNVDQLEQRMRGWLSSGEYRAVLFHLHGPTVAYALYREREDEISLRQFFVARPLRRRGISRQALNVLMSQIWPHTKRLTVSVLTHNEAGLRFWRAIGFTDYALMLEILPKGSADA